MKLSEEIIEAIEENGFRAEPVTEQDGRYYVEISQGTPLGEDWWTAIWFDGTDSGFAQGLYEYWQGFDVDDEVEPYIEMRGTNGVPSSVRELIEDAEWKRDTLGELSKAVSAVIREMESEG